MNPFYFILCFITLVSSVAVNPAHHENNLEARTSSGRGSTAQDATLGIPPPLNVDPKRVQVWIRLDKTIPTEDFYKNDQGFTHTALKNLIREAGGQHTDVVVGNKDKWIEYGIFFERGPWADSAESALGYPTRVRVYDLKPKQNVKWTYVGLLDASIKSPVDPILLEEGSVNAMSRAVMQPLFSLLGHPSGGRISNAAGTTVTFPQIGSPVR
ncbi:hypothetical protein M0657_011777 [Pyricularia oryzae]|nr:hypothetical protein M0657_011777 [Pyricularia oryzae]